MDRLETLPLQADLAADLPDGAPAAGATGGIGAAGSGVSAVALGLALAACDSGGGGGGGGVVAPAPTPTPTVAAITSAQASRFLSQATMGATSADIAEVQSRRFDGWITAEFAKPRATTYWDWLVARGYNDAANINGEAGFDNVMWSQLVGAGDQLRQRVGMALSEMLVVGISGVNLNWRQFAMAAYVDVLMDNAFGNFRTLLDRITTNAAMSSFLTFLNNRRANTTTGAVPDENYARELMQLFTIGLYRLNMDGSRVLSGGQPVETYAPADVSGLARLFTGFTVDSSDSTTPDRYRRPLIINAGTHETGASTFLGVTVPAGATGADALKTALDTIFAHPNVPPFVSKQLIQRLVTSNPSPAYVGRVAARFADNGSGVRGDMQAVIRAILLDDEARADPTGTTAGKLREPVMRLTGWARAFGAASNSGNWTTGDTSSSLNRLAQSMGRAPSVFNFFRPGYVPQNPAFATAGLVAPELQITNEISTVGYINYLQTVVQNSTDLRSTYAELTPLTDPQALVDRVNLLLAAGQVSSATLTQIRTAVESTTNATNRIYIAILLVMASPEYLTLK
ncbi:DUF1800 domain-containing protein [Sphingomonas sp. MG17]|uniref:DUF1800 domain-containing protein n=1 Tax=Sphingomonas tagetis TaxID=2949092 RepID=A0A9X2HNR0_9SPHN|nr:DUF1800 domain-containing protein [Sphingomonas tagetis]MCP3730728.1 DUF1800 domain-containing protein [Sphingomonas tagetis]